MGVREVWSVLRQWKIEEKSASSPASIASRRLMPIRSGRAPETSQKASKGTKATDSHVISSISGDIGKSKRASSERLG
jgi:hypothetical protein